MTSDTVFADNNNVKDNMYGSIDFYGFNSIINVWYKFYFITQKNKILEGLTSKLKQPNIININDSYFVWIFKNNCNYWFWN